jgi:hypothetical protein
MQKSAPVSQEFVFPTSAQQLAVQPVESQLLSTKVLQRVEPGKTESATSESMYDSMFRSMESAGKAVGHAVENMEHKAAEVLLQVPITSEIAANENTVTSGDVVADVTPKPTEVAAVKAIEMIASKPIKAAAEGISKSEPTKTVATKDPSVSAVESPLATISAAKSSPTEVVVKPTTDAASQGKDLPASPSKSGIDNDAVSSSKSIPLQSEFATALTAKASSIAPITATPSVDSPDIYNSLFKKMEAAGKLSSESPSTNPSEILAEVTVTKQHAPLAHEIKEVAKEKTEIAASSITPEKQSSLTTQVSPQGKSSDVYMPEVAPVMAGLGLSKLQAPKAYVPDFKLPSMNVPDFKMPSMNVPDFKMPSMNVPDFKMPSMNAPDFSLPTMNIPDFHLPSISVPEFTMPSVEFPSFDDIPVPVQAAGAIAAGGVVVAVGLSFESTQTVDSTMPPGTKKKGTTYLEGLSRSSTSPAGKADTPSASKSYLEKLAFSSASPQSSSIKTFNFAPNSFDLDMERIDPPSTTVSPAGSSGKKVNGGEFGSTNQSFNFSPNAFDANMKRMIPTGNSEVRGDSIVNGGEKRSDDTIGAVNGIGNGNIATKERFSWSSGADGGFIWSDPVPSQKSGTGLSYLENLNGGSRSNSELNPNGGSYNAYLDAMRRQNSGPDGNPVAVLEQTFSNSPSDSSTNQQFYDGPPPSTIKSFSKVTKSGSYVDSL